MVIGLMLTGIMGNTSVALAQGPDQETQTEVQTPNRKKARHKAIFTVVAETLELTPEALRAELQAGTPLSDIMAEQGVEKDQIAEAVYEYGVEKVETALANGKITEAKADRILAQLAERRDGCINDNRCGLKWLQRQIKRQKRASQIRNFVANGLGLSVEDLKAARQSGESLEEIAAQQGLTLPELAENLYEDGVARVNTALQEGKVTQKRADQLLDKLTKHRDACVVDGHCFARK
ncbi:MAG: hypothetical protein AAF629_00425 [Chloroflexota bacterium]